MKDKELILQVNGKKITITHPQKVLFPHPALTKEDLVNYYTKASSQMLPFVKEHPLSMLRYPSGVKETGFFQKNIPDYFPSWISRMKVKQKDGSVAERILCNNAASLVYLANQNCITPHIWLSAKKKLNYPDRMVFDLDPSFAVSKGVSVQKFMPIAQAALELQEFLEETLKARSFLLSTGSRGIHVWVFIKPTLPYEKVHSIAKKLAASFASRDTSKYTVHLSKTQRKGKIWIDYVRNSYGQTVVAPYAVRATKDASIAIPLSKKDLQGFSPNQVTMQTKISKKNPWGDYLKHAKDLKSCLR